MTSLERVGAPARQVNPRVWRGALFLAERYHWKPAGTERPQMPPDVIRSKEARAFRQWLMRSPVDSPLQRRSWSKSGVLTTAKLST